MGRDNNDDPIDEPMESEFRKREKDRFKYWLDDLTEEEFEEYFGGGGETGDSDDLRLCENFDDQDDKEQGGKTVHHVHKAHHQVVHLTTDVAGNRPIGDADDQ